MSPGWWVVADGGAGGGLLNVNNLTDHRLDHVT